MKRLVATSVAAALVTALFTFPYAPASADRGDNAILKCEEAVGSTINDIDGSPFTVFQQGLRFPSSGFGDNISPRVVLLSATFSPTSSCAFGSLCVDCLADMITDRRCEISSVTPEFNQLDLDTTFDTNADTFTVDFNARVSQEKFVLNCGARNDD